MTDKKKTSVMDVRECLDFIASHPPGGGGGEMLAAVAAEQHRRTTNDVIAVLRIIADQMKIAAERDVLHDAATAIEAQLKAPL
jgi:hypothetical protein